MVLREVGRVQVLCFSDEEEKQLVLETLKVMHPGQLYLAVAAEMVPEGVLQAAIQKAKNG